MVPIVRKVGPQRLVNRFPRSELLGHGLEYPVAAFRIEIFPATAGSYRKGWRTMLPKQAQNFSLNDDPRALHLHRAATRSWMFTSQPMPRSAMPADRPPIDPPAIVTANFLSACHVIGPLVGCRRQKLWKEFSAPRPSGWRQP